MYDKANELAVLVVNELTVGLGIEPFEKTLNNALASLGELEVCGIDYKQNHSVASDGSHIYYDTALITYRRASSEPSELEEAYKTIHNLEERIQGLE